MQQQNYRNHTRYYVPHHFVFYPLLLLLLVIILLLGFEQPAYFGLYITMAAIVLIIGWLSFMLRQHYALTLQNRIVRVEMRLRYYQLTQKSMDHIEHQLSFGQLAALRFVADEELLLLIEKTLAENLSAGDIKKQIKNWQPDHMRV